MTEALKDVDTTSVASEREVFKINSLTKYYNKSNNLFKRIFYRKSNKFLAIDDLSLNLKKGKIVGLLGKNGAGKSTLMRCMLGFLRYSGDIHINGEIVTHAGHSVFNNVAFIPDVSEIDGRLTVEQTIEYIKRIHPKWNQERADKLIQISQLPMDSLVKNLSKGMKTKLYLLITLSLDVEVLLLDEPTIGLDIAFKKEFYNTILGEYFDEDKLIIISTHQIEEIEHLLQEIIFIHEGKLLLHKDIEELKSQYNIVTLPTERSSEIDAHNPLYKTKALGNVSALLPSEINIEGAKLSRPQIADIFLALTGGYNATV